MMNRELIVQLRSYTRTDPYHDASPAAGLGWFENLGFDIGYK